MASLPTHGGQRSGGDSEYSNGDAVQPEPWITWFCKLRSNEFFCEVEESFIQDMFNLTGLKPQVPNYEAALDMILDAEPVTQYPEDQQEAIERDAENLYGLIHARYILTTHGLEKMYEKYRKSEFGFCPRIYCQGQPVVPVGLSDTTNQESVKLYCPRCDEVYAPRSSRHDSVDGAFFGTTFAHLFFLTFPELKVRVPPKESYVPRVFGFRVNKNAYQISYKEKQAREAREQEQQQ